LSAHTENTDDTEIAAAAAAAALSTVLVPKVNCILSSQTNGHEGMEMGRWKRRRW